MELLRVEQLSKQFGGLRAVAEVSFSIAEGEIVGLIGPNGAGKTTLISCIHGTERASGGRVLFAGQDVTDEPPAARAHAGLGRTFQIVRVFKDMTVRDNVVAGALFSRRVAGGLAAAKEKAEEILAFSGLTAKADRLVRETTLPDQKRLQIARALAGEPRFLILDEAMAGLNPSEVDEAVRMVHRIRERGVTILVIEHLMRVIMGISDRILVMHQGHLIAEGKPAEVIDNTEVIGAYFGERYRQRMGGGSGVS